MQLLSSARREPEGRRKAQAAHSVAGKRTCSLRQCGSIELYGLTQELEKEVAQALTGDNPRQLCGSSARFTRRTMQIERYSGQDREALVTVLGRYFDPETLTYLDDKVREEIIPLLDDDVLRNAMEMLESDDTVEILGELDDADQARLLDALPDYERAMVEGLTYDEASGPNHATRDGHGSAALDRWADH